ncbi:hypothetical protein Ddye_002779 [Dipteronia dyeriana]|uniref:Peptidase C45 hydrolase domain-containing protein n=1 Tax=Dipteronia dyeriana TaxID=168575 RepID=A0AAD9XRT6_9ROSI|nr:hypothetical protein Ddye_002779 [Dipteronia dyeriana]
MGFLIGQRFSNLIRTRVSKDIILQNQTRPLAQSSPESEQFITTLSEKHRNKFPGYWDELLGTAEGSGVPVLDIILVNFRKEILALISKTEIDSNVVINVDTPEDDCCDVLVVNDSMAIAAHNEDGDFDVIGNTYLLKCTFSSGPSFMPYSYPGELPTCYGVAFTLNAVAPMKDEIAADGIGRNFISRDLLEATDIDDALLVQDEHSISKEKRAAVLPKETKDDILSLLGDTSDAKYPIYREGQRFSNLIRSRLSRDLILQNQLRPFVQSPESHRFIETLSMNNRNRFPRYWDELLGTAEGSGVPALDIILINFRKEILPFVSKTKISSNVNVDTAEDDCSDVLVVNDSMAIAAHNEDANVALVGHTYLIKSTLSNGLSFMAYTYAGELPSCAFGFNSHGLGFTLNSVPPVEDEIVVGGIGRNFISRDLLEATDIEDALLRICSSEVSVGHSYNLIDVKRRQILNVETASKNRVSIHNIEPTPFFHANMYLHLKVQQVQDESSISRQKRATVLPKGSKDDFLSLLGDTNDAKYPVYMTGPTLYTLCTAVIDLDEQTLTIIEGNPKKGQVSHVFSISSEDFMAQ